MALLNVACSLLQLRRAKHALLHSVKAIHTSAATLPCSRGSTSLMSQAPPNPA